MISGIILIIAGILIALFPPILSIIVSVLLIFTGGMIFAIAYYNRKLSRRYDNPIIELFFRL